VRGEQRSSRVTNLRSFFLVATSKTELFASTQISQLINKYIKTHNLVNQNDQAYVNLDDLLRASVLVKVKTNAKAETGDAEKPLQFMRRDELVKNVLERMQSWYEIRVGGKEVVIK
jgi:translation initiation factor 2D